tara:strand:+ start:264 stop:596 length:333 start_codon:yes stop_codon:yes gene_type:complete
MYKLTGTIKTIKETQVITNSFSKREFVINDASSQYPQDVIFQSVQDKCLMLDGYSGGDSVEVSFNLRGREWTSPTGDIKYFNTLDAWKIEPVSGSTSTPTPTAEDDDLPF